ncbi:formyl transferase [Hwangdonia sp.]|uniref:formyl transferase n=1 Tax=Hwangdonia sp. TaxID=1883432 RepID=UPI003AB2638E
MEKKIVMLVGSGGGSSACSYNALKEEYNILHVIVDGPMDKKKFIKRRIKKLGLFTVTGQLLFRTIMVPYLERESKARVKEIAEQNNLLFNPIDEEMITQVPSVNSEECIALLKELSPDIVVVNGTRIIARKVLNCIPGIFVNTHAGMTPLYRGVHGAYWSKVNKDGLCGVSVHLVDPGIDTGGILFQELIETNKKDNFSSYTYLQMAKGIELMKKALNSIINEEQKVIKNNLDSKLWSHPTIWFYLKHRIINKVK